MAHRPALAGWVPLPRRRVFRRDVGTRLDAVLGLWPTIRAETIVAVSHADPIKAVVAASAGIPIDLMQRLVISPCSVSAMLFSGGGPVILCVNSTGTPGRVGAVVRADRPR